MIVQKSFSLEKYKQYRSSQSPSFLTAPRFSSCFANISPGLDSLPGERTQTFIPEISAIAQFRYHLAEKHQKVLQLSPLDSGSAPSCSYCPAPHLAAWPRTLSKHSHSIYIQVVQFFGCMCSFFPEQGLYFLPQTVIMLEQILIFGLEHGKGGQDGEVKS